MHRFARPLFATTARHPAHPAAAAWRVGAFILAAVFVAATIASDPVAASGPTLVVAPTEVETETRASAKGSGFAARTRILLLLDGATRVGATATDRSGRFSTTFQVPVVEPGRHVVTAWMANKRGVVYGEAVTTSVLVVADAEASGSPTSTVQPTSSPAPSPTPTPTPTPALTAAPSATPPPPSPSPTPSGSAAGPTFYVASTGSDSYDGTLARPWKTIGKALGATPLDATILVRAGSYGPVTVSRSRVTIASYPGEIATLAGGSTPITITGSNVSLQSVRVTGGISQGVWIDGATDIRLAQVQVEGNLGAGIQVIRSARIHVVGSVIRDNGRGGLRELDGTTDGYYALNTITGNGHDGNAYNGDGVLLQGSGALVEYNTIARNGDSDIYEHGIYAAQVASGYVLRSNRLEQNSASAIKASGTGLVTGNTISGSPRGIVFADAGGRVEVRGNTVDAAVYTILVTSNCDISRYRSDGNTFILERFAYTGRVLNLDGWRQATGLDAASD